MGFFDKFWPRTQPESEAVAVDVHFTEEEEAAIAISMKSFAEVENGDGQSYAIDPSVVPAMTARALVQYVEFVTGQVRTAIERDNAEEAYSLMQKAIRAQVKAYAVYNLPAYLFRAAEMMQAIRDVEQAKRFYGMFLKVQADYTLEKIDEFLLNEMEFDVDDAVSAASEKLG